mgnify:CR=1 FL=1
MNYKKLVEKAVVTFVEAAVAYLSLNGWNFGNKTVLAGAMGAGLSAAYNVAKQLKG